MISSTSLRISRLLALGIAATGLFGATAALFAAGPQMKTLPGHVPAAAVRSFATGILQPTERLRLAIGLPLRDASGLDQFLAQVYDPASPNFRRFLTPEQFTERFGPTAEDYGAVAEFARTNGLSVAATHGNRLLLDVTGSAADIQRAFHITLRTYSHPSQTRDFFAPDTEPSVEGRLPICDISGLNNYDSPHPMSFKRERPAAGSGAVPMLGSGRFGPGRRLSGK